MFKSFRSEKSAAPFHQPGLEYWFKERRTFIDFRPGPLGSYVDGFAASLKAKGCSYNWGRKIFSHADSCPLPANCDGLLSKDKIREIGKLS
jgi:hypothetical protein